MNKVTILRKGNLSLGLKRSGHALSREEIENTIGDAYDLICNSVSVLSQSVVIGIEEVLELPVKYEINDGYLSLNLSELKEDEIEKGQVLLKTFEKSMESVMMSLESSFGKNKRNKYINLKNEEV